MRKGEKKGKEGAHCLVKVHHRAGTRLRRSLRSQQQMILFPYLFATSESQELTRDSHILSTGRTEWGKACAQSNKEPKDRGQALVSLGCCLPVPTLGTIEEMGDEEGHTNFS